MWSTRERAGFVAVGVGLGGLLDGVVLHQLLQWHHVWSSKTTDKTVAGLEENTLADGIVQLAFLAVLVLGMTMLSGRPLATRPSAGLAVIGWGAFNLLDQLVFHLALGAHHIREDVDTSELYDWAFFALGLVLVVVRLVMVRSASAGVRTARRMQLGRS